jgi:hypothetical protein
MVVAEENTHRRSHAKKKGRKENVVIMKAEMVARVVVSWVEGPGDGICNL